MGQFIYNNVYLPSKEEIDWDENVNNNFSILANLCQESSNILQKISALNTELASVQNMSNDSDDVLDRKINSLRNELNKELELLTISLNNLRNTVNSIETGEAQHAVRSDTSALADIAKNLQNSLTINGTNFNGSNPISLSLTTQTEFNTLSSSLQQAISEIQGRLDQVESVEFKIEVLPQLPETGNGHTIYLVPKSTGNIPSNAKDEYVWSNGRFELIGDTEAKITNFYTKDQTDSSYVSLNNDQVINGYKVFTNTIKGNLNGVADKATKLDHKIKINDTEFDGSENITTVKWGQYRFISIYDYDKTNTTKYKVDGSADVDFILPRNIKFVSEVIGTSEIGTLNNTTANITNLTNTTAEIGTLNNTLGNINTLNTVNITNSNKITSKDLQCTNNIQSDSLNANSSSITALTTGNITNSNKITSKDLQCTNNIQTNSLNANSSSITTLSGNSCSYTNYYGHYNYTVPVDTSEYVFTVNVANNDGFRIKCGGGNDAGYVSFETHDNATEPVYFKQCNGLIEYTITLMDANHNSNFCGNITAPKFIGNLQGNVNATDITTTNVKASSVNSSSITANNITVNTKITSPDFSGTFNGTANGTFNGTINASSLKLNGHTITIVD